jgi:DNA (cytosine-5)-methyltransferase 1
VPSASVLYSEWDAPTAEWLSNLIHLGYLPPGVVDRRSIAHLTPADVIPFHQVHFFAGIGGWSEALRLAQWPDEVPVWTGSCPCQPFSSAGLKKGLSDERDLWPAMQQLIAAARPQFVFGEQVPTAIGYGWIDRVCDDLEAEGYQVGYVVLGAHSVGAPHIRQRLYWAARLGHSGGSSSQRNLPVGHHDLRSLWAEGGPSIESGPAGAWADSTEVACRDRSTRRISAEPCAFPLAHGFSGGVGRRVSRNGDVERLAAKRNYVLRTQGYGNAIVPQVAAVFLRACMDEWGIAQRRASA